MPQSIQFAIPNMSRRPERPKPRSLNPVYRYIALWNNMSSKLPRELRDMIYDNLMSREIQYFHHHPKPAVPRRSRYVRDIRDMRVAERTEIQRLNRSLSLALPCQMMEEIAEYLYKTRRFETTRISHISACLDWDVFDIGIPLNLYARHLTIDFNLIECIYSPVRRKLDNEQHEKIFLGHLQHLKRIQLKSDFRLTLKVEESICLPRIRTFLNTVSQLMLELQRHGFDVGMEFSERGMWRNHSFYCVCRRQRGKELPTRRTPFNDVMLHVEKAFSGCTNRCADK